MKQFEILKNKVLKQLRTQEKQWDPIFFIDTNNGFFECLINNKVIAKAKREKTLINKLENLYELENKKTVFLIDDVPSED